MTMHPHRRMPEQRHDPNRFSERSTASSTSAPHDREMHYRHQQQPDASMELARHGALHSHNPPQLAEATVYRSVEHNDSRFKTSPLHLHEQQPPTHPGSLHTTAASHSASHGMGQLSPNFHSRSSPIAIIHNPEDSVAKAKLRWQHPMYDTSDDEGDNEDALMQGGISVESLTSPEAPRSSAHHSLPTALLRAPKLGSLPSQDYRLLHLATLPPPMSLNADVDQDATMEESHATSGICSPQKPRYLSSYGSLRESHLTGRFGAETDPKVKVAASTGQLQNPENRSSKVHVVGMEPPATLIPPRNPQPQTKQPDSSPLSIRDRMIQKARQQKEESSKEKNQVEKKKAASSLSAMLANDDTLQNSKTSDGEVMSGENQGRSIPISSTPPTKRASLPASMANAVAISYNSNMNLFGLTRGRENTDDRQEARTNERELETPTVLSSSMTGLEVLRAASKARPTVRPTSLNILQGSTRTMDGAPPPPTTAPTTFMHLSRTMSEPSPYSPSQNPSNSTSVLHRGQASALSSALGHGTPTYYNNNSLVGVVRTMDGRMLLPPQAMMSSMTSIVSSSRPSQTHQAPSRVQPSTSQNPGAGLHCAAGTMPTTSSHSRGSQIEDSNPDVQGAFDMDLE